MSFLITLATGAALVTLAHARVPAPVALQPSSWQGIDGNWSMLAFDLGSNLQQVDVLVSTALSEFWAVGPGGCLPREPHCSTARGGIFSPDESTDWASLGTWQLGLDYLRYGGNGDYGTDDIAATNVVDDKSFHMSSVLIATVNTTNYLNGLFGLGITQGNFGGTVAESPLTQAVKTFGWIPSYSYGYTAGAHYRNTPVSLTLGGYDSSRFENHNNDFTLNRDDGLPRVLVRGIEVSADEGQGTPGNWDSRQTMLSNWNSSFEVIIDSTTPYLWLPDNVCDQFAAAFNLTYNSTFDLYTISDERYTTFLDEQAFSFTFVLSSFDNKDNFGDPYDVTGVVNITIPSRAFTGLLQYPFMNRTIAYGEPAIPYFMLRRGGNSTWVLGRSFLQESYLITKYDEVIFRIHQARFPDSFDKTDLVAIEQTTNSPYPPPAKFSEGLSKAKQAGIGVGAGLAVVGLLAAALWWCRRRRNKREYERSGSSIDENKASVSIVAANTPRSPFQRIVSKILRRKRSPSVGLEDDKSAEKPSEAPNSQIYELPAPIPPAELDGDDGNSWNGDTEMGSNDSQQLSAYENARRKLDQQLQGPVPAYTPPADGALPPPEKAIYEPSPPRRPPPTLQLSPTPPPRSPVDGSSNSTSVLLSLPSPMTPRQDLTSRSADFPSPMTATMPALSAHKPSSNSAPSSPFLLPSNSQSDDIDDLRRSQSNREAFPASTLEQTTPAIQRTPIDPSKVICLGPLPGNARFSRSQPMMEARNRSDSEGSSKDGHGTYDTLGSNYTVEEEEQMAARLRAPYTQLRETPVEKNRPGQLRRNRPENIIPPASAEFSNPSRVRPHLETPRSPERIDSGTEIIHVPQLAEKRYSWEDDR
ncbi:aspartic peptidase domain-containing protein [Thelonectria olida]|uniref:Aspartic peptidase domain-containing protein n=1 Tax=Thelonectria olida TaxID=1576542 RepID=A0A9P8WF32_9HYPO|nr:aspartic peptidase domain-containing protein [Thelonectria olida]